MVGASRALCIAVCVASLGACGGKSETSSTSTGGSGGASGGVGGSSTGGSGGSVTGGSGGATGGVGGNIGGGGAPTGGAAGAGGCTPKSYGDGSPPPSCTDVDGLAVSDLTASDAGGDGTFSPGESGSLAVKLTQTTGYDFYWYPTVYFEADNPAVGFGSNGAVSLYGIGGCQTSNVDGSFTLGSGIASGTVIHITARAGALNLTCPGASTVTLSLTVQ